MALQRSRTVVQHSRMTVRQREMVLRQREMALLCYNQAIQLSDLVERRLRYANHTDIV